MSDQSPPSAKRYQVIGVRRDGSRTTLFGPKPWDDANRSREAVEAAGIFADVLIEPVVDSGDDKVLPD